MTFFNYYTKIPRPILFTENLSSFTSNFLEIFFEILKKGKKEKFLIYMEFHQHATITSKIWYRVSALTRYSVARDKCSIERRFTVNRVRNLQWCIVVLYRWDRERERERTNRETRFRFEVAFSISPFIGKRGVGIFVLSIVALLASSFTMILNVVKFSKDKTFPIFLFLKPCSKKMEFRAFRLSKTFQLIERFRFLPWWK